METENSRPQHPRGRRHLVLWAVVLLLVLGHLSNVVGHRACERKVLSWYVQEYTEGQPLRYSQEETMSPVLYWTLEAIGAKFEVVSPEEYKKNPFPSCGIEPAQPLCPFIVAVRLDHIEGGLGGAGGSVYVFNFFGACLVLWHQTDWVA